MKTYSIVETSKMLNIPKHTLRYYDKMNLISPERLDNKYRRYTEKDFIDLKCIYVMKFAGFTLLEIKKILNNKNNVEPSIECKNDTLNVLSNKYDETLLKLEQFKRIANLIEISTKIIEGKQMYDFEQINNLILDVYNCLDRTNNKGENDD